ncbi:MAG TPA: serine protease [Prolixibacteraceae bacterium]
MVRRILISFFIILSIFIYRVEGQVSYGGSPASFNSLKSLQIQLPVIGMDPVNNYDLQLKDLQSRKPFKKYTFAKSFDVDISPANSGVWDEANGMKIWRVGIKSAGAYSLNIIFDRAILPTGASIFIYTPDHQIVRGAFNANNEQSSGMLPIYPIPGDEIIVEYNEPNNVSYPGDLHIFKVNHDYKNVIGTRPLGESGSCNMDVYCKEAAVLLKEKQAVVQLVIGGTDLCTGTFVNNTRMDKTPYLLTAGHCILKASEAQLTVFSFNYESPFCGQNGSTNGFADQTMTGSILRARSDSLDFALVELEMIPPASYRPYYVGWDRSKTTPPNTRSIHHPMADVKKVSVDLLAPGIASYSVTGHVLNNFWWIKKWDIGTTEAGSSGGPLFNDSNLLIGSLTGGNATCSSSIDDYFSMFSFQWNYSSLASRQLKVWLDPDNTGLTKVDAIDPYASGNTCDQFSDVKAGEKYESAKVINGKGYVSGHNSFKITSYAQQFRQTEKSTLSAFSVGVSKAITGVNNSNSVVDFQIYQMNTSTGMPGTVLKTVRVPIKSLKASAMNFIALDQPLDIIGTYFIGYDLKYSNTSDSVAMLHAVPRATDDLNHAFCRIDNSWQPFYWVPEINMRTSFLINSYGCGTTFAINNPLPVPAGSTQFRIYYPTDASLNLLYLVNSGNEEFGRVICYDMLGRKVSETQRMLTTGAIELSVGWMESSVYFVTVETLTKREVIKVRIIRNR